MSAEKIKKKAEEFFAHLQIEGEVEVEPREEGVRVNLKTEEGGLWIGRGGRILKALGRLLRLVLKEAGQGLMLDINDYQKKKIDRLQELAFRMAEKAKSEGRPQVLPYMNAYERRIIHLALKDREDVTAESEGEEPYRRVVIKPKN